MYGGDLLEVPPHMKGHLTGCVRRIVVLADTLHTPIIELAANTLHTQQYRAHTHIHNAGVCPILLGVWSISCQLYYWVYKVKWFPPIPPICVYGGDPFDLTYPIIELAAIALHT